MEWFCIRLSVESWMASAWQADTIWGHLCWGLRYKYGEEALLDFIEAYERGNPPLLLSNGFPNDMLPYPIVPEVPLAKEQSLVQQREEFRQRKRAKGIKLLNNEEFAEAIKGGRFTPTAKGEFERRMVTLKNQINRATSTTGGPEEATGRLFSFEQYKWGYVSIYARIQAGFEKRCRELFHYLETTGYGKRKSAGYGWVKVEEFKPFDGFTTSADANGFVSLSSFVPAAHDPVSGYWEALIKYGKLGEGFASRGNPFKKPLIMFTAGSCFYDSPCRMYYGRLVKGLCPALAEGVVQYGFALPVPIKLPSSC